PELCFVSEPHNHRNHRRRRGKDREVLRLGIGLCSSTRSVSHPQNELRSYKVYSSHQA
ncbi:hypothetical protein GBA52_014571, partial [Prunus armeniaca]